MLPPFIIEQIRRREEEERKRDEVRRDNQRPRLELPVPMGGGDRRPRRPADRDECEEQADRGVIVVDLLGD
jgi:hypothetical protein